MTRIHRYIFIINLDRASLYIKMTLVCKAFQIVRIIYGTQERSMRNI